MSNPYGYAGWFVMDLRLLVFVLLISLLLTAGSLALGFRGRRWQDYVGAGMSLYLFFTIGLIFIFNILVKYPVFRVESFFPFP